MSIKKFTLLFSFFILFIPLIQSQTLTLTYPNKQVCGNTVSIPLTVANFDSITGMQFSTTWDASILHFEAISGFNSTIGLQNSNFNLGNTNNGYFTFAWFASSSIETGYTLNDGDTMFIATFTVINTLQNQVPIQFSNVPTHINYSNAIVSADLVQDTNDGLVSLDNSGPSSTCPNDTLINIPSNQSSVAVGGLTPTFTDACGISSVTYNAIGATTSSGLNDASNSTFNVGTTVLTYTFSDILNNQSTCSFSINVSNDPSLVLRIVNDTVDCQAIASLDITASNFRDISRLQTSLNWDNAQLQYSSITNFGLPNFDISDFDLNFTNAGILGMNWENIGDIGVTFPNNSVLFTINFNVNSSNGQNFNVNFSDNPIVTGATQATTGTSVAIQTNSGSVVVKDSTNPTITCPSNQSYTIPITSNTSTVTDLQVTTSDNCPSNLTVGYNITGSTVGGGNGVLNSYNFLVGTSTVTYTATDLGGLSNSCSFTVDVIRDIQDTLIITPVSQTVNCDNGTVDVAFHVSNFDLVQLLNFDLNWDTNILTYNSINNVGLPGFDSSNIDETDTSLGILNIHYTSDFANGVTLPDNTQIFILRFNIIPTSNANTNINFSNLSLSIGTPQVNAMVIGQNGVISFQDQTAPVIICPGRVVQEVSNSTIDATVNFLTPLVNDNCTDDVQVTYAITGQTTASGQSDASGTTFNLGLSTLSYQAVDLSGNTTQCQTSVYVVNPLLVNLDDLAISCADTQFVMPLRVIHFDSISNLSFSITWDPTHLTLNDITDFFSSDISIANFDMTNVSNGKIGFSWNSTSNAGVFLNDNTALFNLVFKPTNFSINSSINVAITDDVNPINAVSGTIAQIDLPVTTNQTTLIVYDGESPTIDCPSDVYVGADTNERTATVNNITPSIFDNCEIQGVTYNISGTTTGSGTGDASGTQFNVGNSYVTYTVSDLAGNTDECSFRVRVRDTVLTVFTENLEIPCESNRIVPVEVKVENFNAITGVRFTMNWDPSVLRFDSVRNNANLPLLTDSNFDLSFTSLGLGSIVWYSAAPITLVDTSTIFTMYFLAIGDPGTSSQFDFTNTLVNPGFSSVNSSNQGVLISNFTLQNAQIDIIDEIAPTISCPPFIYSQLDEVLGATEIFGIGPRDTSDNCVIQSVLWSVTGATTDSGSGSASGTLFNEGYSNVTYTITDLVGNQSSCSFGVNVQPAVVPDILTVRADTTTISCETDTIRIPITVENFNLLLGLQYTMNWDPTVLEYVGIDILNTLMGLDATDFGMSLVSNGSLTMSWYDL
ncbi:MAG: HYR domain-containing protein, partial [Saprospiraceae bacterium]|nr:HYR domain-containing protein [Saprospiraceae bacterium]